PPPRIYTLALHDALPISARHARPVEPTADTQTLETIADWLVSADRPLIMAGSTGRYAETVATLTALAEALGAPVSGCFGTRLNIDRKSTRLNSSHVKISY